MRKFCVIGSRCSSAIDRTMKETEDDAVKHALKLMGQQKAGRYPEAELYVVEVRKIVRPAQQYEVVDAVDEC